MSGKHHRHLCASERREIDARRRRGMKGIEIEGREEFLRDNAVSIVKELDRYIASLRWQVRLLTNQRDAARRALAALRQP